MPAGPKPPLLPSQSREARRTRAGDSSTRFKFGVERTNETLAANAAAAATIKLGGASVATPVAVAAMATEDAAQGCCCSLMPF